MTYTQDFVAWIGITYFEAWSFSSALIIFIGLMIAKLDRYIYLNWEEIFLPLYINDIFAAFFCYNCFVRQLAIQTKKVLFLKLFWSWFLILCSFMIKNGILQRINEPVEYTLLIFYTILFIVCLIAKLYLDPFIRLYTRNL